jgi:heme-degrading monooxygenase HmoA
MPMFARVSSYEGPPEKIDEGIVHAMQTVMPQARRLPGLKGVVSLADRQTGRELTMTVWESEEAMRASEEEGNRLRAEAAAGAAQRVLEVERYEVVVYELRD